MSFRKLIPAVCLIILGVVHQTTSSISYTNCKMDAVFVIDNSDSITSAKTIMKNWDMVLEFAQHIAKQLNIAPDYTHVGLVDFHSYATVHFGLNKYTNEKAAVDAIGRLAYKGYSTNTPEALEYGRNVLTSNLYGARKGVPKVMFIITDGEPAKKYLAGLDEEIYKTKQAGIRIIAVGVTKEVKVDTLKKLASSDRGYFVAKKFEDLDVIKDLVLNEETCEPPPPPPTTTKKPTTTTKPPTTTTTTQTTTTTTLPPTTTTTLPPTTTTTLPPTTTTTLPPTTTTTLPPTTTTTLPPTTTTTLPPTTTTTLPPTTTTTLPPTTTTTFVPTTETTEPSTTSTTIEITTTTPAPYTTTTTEETTTPFVQTTTTTEPPPVYTTTTEAPTTPEPCTTPKPDDDSDSSDSSDSSSSSSSSSEEDDDDHDCNGDDDDDYDYDNDYSDDDDDEDIPECDDIIQHH